MAAPRHYDQDKDSTLYVGNLDERCGDALVWELMLQAGPVINVHLPKDRVTQTHQGYGFVEFASEEDADYAAKIMNQIRLWGKPIRVNKASADKRGMGTGANGVPGSGGEGQGVGAELFVGNLDSMVDEKVLFETFQRFGPLVAPPKISRDESNLSKGYGFISYASFEASDDAITNMHGQYLSNKEITVQYAYKKDGKGERHGDPAERALAEQAKKHGVQVAIPAMPAALVMPNTPSAPQHMNGMSGFPNGAQGYSNGAQGYHNGMSTPQLPPSYNYGAYNPSPVGGYNSMPPPTPSAQYMNDPPRSFAPSPLTGPPSGVGLPARPPPPNAGYGGPPAAPGMQQAYPGAPPHMAPPGMPPMMPPGGFGYPPNGPPNGYPPQQR